MLKLPETQRNLIQSTASWFAKSSPSLKQRTDQGLVEEATVAGEGEGADMVAEGVMVELATADTEELAMVDTAGVEEAVMAAEVEEDGAVAEEEVVVVEVVEGIPGDN